MPPRAALASVRDAEYRACESELNRLDRENFALKDEVKALQERLAAVEGSRKLGANSDAERRATEHTRRLDLVASAARNVRRVAESEAHTWSDVADAMGPLGEALDGLARGDRLTEGDKT